MQSCNYNSVYLVCSLSPRWQHLSQIYMMRYCTTHWANIHLTKHSSISKVSRGSVARPRDSARLS